MQHYKCLCAGITICATIVAQKFDFYIWPSNPGKYVKLGWICRCIYVRCTCRSNLVTTGQ